MVRIKFDSYHRRTAPQRTRDDPSTRNPNPMTSTVFPPDSELDQVLVGPDSVTWRITSDARLYSVMLYPLLLQVAHPTVGAGVRDYSDFERRPWNRLLRTIDYVTLLVYGGPDAVPAGRRLRDMPQAVPRRPRGRPALLTRSSPTRTRGSTRR